MTIYRYSPFKSNALGHGGEKRSYQITKLLEDLAITTKNLDLFINMGSRFSRLLKFPSNYKLIRSLKLPIRSVRQCWKMANLFYCANEQTKNIHPHSVIIYEHSLLLNWAMPFILKNKGHKIIAFPHNLETLVIGNHSKLSELPNPDGLFDEISVLKTANLVLTISKEEAWLLNLFGINAKYFPYSPSLTELTNLEQIATVRNSRRPDKSFMILGTVTNSPTKLGILDLITELNKPETENMTFHIAGFGTEKLVFNTPLPDRFKLLGSVETGRLYDLYRNIDAAILHQKPSTGALTKITELLAAKVPLIANINAARNYFNIEGITVYRNYLELLKALQSNIDSTFGYSPEQSDLISVKYEIQSILANDHF